MIVSAIAIFWVNKVRNALKNSKNDSAKKVVAVIDDYILPILKQGQETVEATQKQEVKAKQFGEILYDFMGPKANEIKDKYQVKLTNLTADVDKAVDTSVVYNEKLKAMEALVEEMKSQYGKEPPVDKVVITSKTIRDAMP